MLHVAGEGGIGEWEDALIRKWAFEGFQITDAILKERRAELAQIEVRKIRESMPTPPTSARSWREQFADAVVQGHVGKTKLLMVAIMLHGDDEKRLVPGLGALVLTRDTATNCQLVQSWLKANKAAAVQKWEKLEFPEHPDYLDSVGSSSSSSGDALAASKKVVIFDLDQTLTTVHAEKEFFHPKTMVDVLFGGRPVLLLPTTLLAAARPGTQQH